MQRLRFFFTLSKSTWRPNIVVLASTKIISDPIQFFRGSSPCLFVGKTMPWTSHFKMVKIPPIYGVICVILQEKKQSFAMNSSFWLLTALILIAQWRKIPTFIAMEHGPFVDDWPMKNAGFPWPSFCWFSRNPMFWSNPSFQAPGGSSCITGGAKPPLFCGTVAFVGCFCKGWNTIGFLPDLYHWIPLWSLFWLTPTNGFITIYTRHDQSLMNQCHIPYINYVGLEYHWIYNYLYQ